MSDMEESGGDDGHLDDLDLDLDLCKSIESPRSSKLLKIDMEYHNDIDNQGKEFVDTNPGQIQQIMVESKIDDGLGYGHSNSNNDDFQPKPAKLLKIEEFYDDKNPFEIPVILDIIFKSLSFEDLKKFRLVSSAWNEVSLKELSKKPKITIKFNSIEDLEDDNKFGELIQLKKRHTKLFGVDHQLFSDFSFNIQLLMSPQIDQFLENFSPKVIKFFGYTISEPLSESGAVKEEESGHQIPQFLSKFLIKISPTVEEIEYYNDLYLYFGDKSLIQPDKELALTKFPNLRKINLNLGRNNNDTIKMFFYPILGQNSPKLSKLRIGSNSNTTINLGSSEEMKEMFESSGLMSKLKILGLYHVNTDLLNVFTEFAQNGVLKLTELMLVNDNSEWVNVRDSFVQFIATQGESLKILRISTPFSTFQVPPSIIQVPFPALQKLYDLQIDNFSSFELLFKPINFSIQFPNLVEFVTFDIRKFLYKNLGDGGNSIEAVRLYKREKSHFGTLFLQAFEIGPLDFVKFGQIFPNSRILQLDFDKLPLSLVSYSSPEFENPFWPKLRVIYIDCELKDLLNFKFILPLLKDIKLLDVTVNSEIKLIDEKYYKEYLGGLIMEENDDNSGYYSREFFYKKFLAIISKDFKSIDFVLTICGHRISEDFKQDFLSIFPKCTFISTPFKDPSDSDC